MGSPPPWTLRLDALDARAPRRRAGPASRRRRRPGRAPRAGAGWRRRPPGRPTRNASGCRSRGRRCSRPSCCARPRGWRRPGRGAPTAPAPTPGRTRPSSGRGRSPARSRPTPPHKSTVRQHPFVRSPRFPRCRPARADIPRSCRPIGAKGLVPGLCGASAGGSERRTTPATAQLAPGFGCSDIEATVRSHRVTSVHVAPPQRGSVAVCVGVLAEAVLPADPLERPSSQRPLTHPGTQLPQADRRPQARGFERTDQLSEIVGVHGDDQLVVLSPAQRLLWVAPSATGTSSSANPTPDASASRCRSSARPSDTSIMACAPARRASPPSRSRATGRR